MPASVSIGHPASKYQQKHQENDHEGPARDNCASEKVSGVHDSLTLQEPLRGPASDRPALSSARPFCGGAAGSRLETDGGVFRIRDKRAGAREQGPRHIGYHRAAYI
jgi:hypothetical protein